MAYQQKYKLYEYGCSNCEKDTAMKGVSIGGIPIANYQPPHAGENYIEIEPVTGLMTKSVRSYTMVYSDSCFSHNNICEYSQLPFPSLDQYGTGI